MNCEPGARVQIIDKKHPLNSAHSIALHSLAKIKATATPPSLLSVTPQRTATIPA